MLADATGTEPPPCGRPAGWSSGGAPVAADATDFVATTTAVLRHDTAAELDRQRAPVTGTLHHRFRCVRFGTGADHLAEPPQRDD